MELDFALLADGVTARPDGKLDVFGAGFDTIHAAGVPAVHRRLVLAIRILVSRHEARYAHQIDVAIQGADGADIAEAALPVEALDEERRARIPAGRKAGVGLLAAFEDIVFPAFGAYQVVIQWDGNEARPPLALFVVDSSSQA